MIEDEIIKHLPEAVGVAKVAAASIPFTAIVKRMLGPAADELAEMWKDQIRLYRYERQLKCVEKAEKMAKDAGFTPKAVPPKILFPLLEGASFEEDESLHDMWAALLANAASSENGGRVKPGFIAILRQMSPDEARLLEIIYDETLPWESVVTSFCDSVGAPQDESGRRLGECLDGLESAKLVRLSTVAKESMLPFERASLWDFGGSEILGNPSGHGQLPHLIITKTDLSNTRVQLLTYRGIAFIEACRPPKPKS